MSIGPVVRKLFGPYEHALVELYRRPFVNLNAFVSAIAADEGSPAAVLEVGCGEGAVTERLARAFPAAEIVGIDITERVGRLFRGDRARVTFVRRTVQSLADERPGAFDLVVVADVLHHVPPAQREDFLAAAYRLVAPAGRLIFKDWVRSRGLMHVLCWASDRLITGDRVKYHSEDELRGLAATAMPDGVVAGTSHVPPCHNNVVLTVRRAPTGTV